MDVDQTVARIEELLELAGGGPAEELMRLLMQLYGEGLKRILAVLKGSEYAARLAEDKLVGSLFLLHDLHPIDPETRLRDALRRLEAAFGSHFELAGISEKIARIRIGKNGAPLPAGIAQVIERAALDAAPEIEAVAVEGLPAAPLVQIGI
ncbi:MAG TPA: hypothetical protein VKX39_17725 [Bryobacteraceae bacterium]|nr:hypothetical protein [Bryobacteraceae bacterium]